MITRRTLGAGALGVLAASCAPAPNFSFPAPRSRQFPQGFRWGVASAAYQTEGSREADGRGPSVWDVFPAEKIYDRSDASVACDSYRRYAEDADLIRAASLGMYRFSVAWPRIVPDGVSAMRMMPAGWTGVNQAGLDHYSRMTDALLERGITPYVTLFHWDLPQALQERGGWAARDTAQRFADYAALMSEALGDRVKHWIVMNEAAVHTFLGHVLGTHAPGLADPSLIGAVTHHLNLAQGLGVQAMRAGRSDLEVGTTLALTPSRPSPGVFLNVPAAEGFDAVWNGAFLDPLLKGSYPEAAQSFLGELVLNGDLAITRQPVDFIGVNYYSPAYMRFDLMSDAHIASGRVPDGVELDAFGRHIDPSGLWEMLAHLRDEYGNPRVMITENGCSDAFSAGPAELNDQFRIDYLRRHLEVVLSSIEAGSQIEGYFHWTLIDNWEWAEGYRSKFGLVAMDRESGVRTPKASHAWFKALAVTGLLDAGAER